MHNSLAPQAAGAETVVGLSVAPKLFQGILATWESPEGFGAWGNVCCLISELAPQKKIIKKVPDGMDCKNRKRKESICFSASWCSVSTIRIVDSGLKWRTSMLSFRVCNA